MTMYLKICKGLYIKNNHIVVVALHFQLNLYTVLDYTYHGNHKAIHKNLNLNITQVDKNTI